MHKPIRERNWPRAGLTALAALLAAVLIMNYARSEELKSAQLRISAVYEKAFYETCELTEGISTNYRKLLVAGDDAQMLNLLGDLSRQTQGAAGNLALLPLGEETISATIKFINQAEDFAESLSRRISEGSSATEEDYEAMALLSENAARFSVGLNRLLERFENGEAVFDASDYTENGDETLYPLTQPQAEYPVLLYDGPFSDGAGGGSFEMLAGAQEVSQEEAAEALKRFVAADSVRFVRESKPEVDIYEFSVDAGGAGISAGVTKRGGEILYLLPESDILDVNYTEAELCDVAQAFLISRGYGTMEMSYYSRYGGILTINYAAIQDGVVLYPDLVKIQLSMADARVIGLDATGYLRNHRLRSLALPAVDAATAEMKIGPRLSASEARLCVIPLNGAEYLCYEITATDGQGEFLAYVDAESGVERELMQVISRENGTLVM